MQAIHKCREDMICLLPGERKYKCYKCLDREKDYIHKDEVAQVISPFCLEIVDREIIKEKRDKYIQYSVQKQFTEQQVDEIMNTYNIPDEQRQNPQINELREIIKKQNTKIDCLNKERENLDLQLIWSKHNQEALQKDLSTIQLKCKQQQIEIESLMKYIQQLNQPQNHQQCLSIRDIYNKLNWESTLLDIINQQHTVDILNILWKDLQVKPWMIEWALRSGNMEMYKRLLEKYFEGIQVYIYGHLDDGCSRNQEFHQTVAIQICANFSLPPVYGFIHIIYNSHIKYQLCRIPIESINSHVKDADIEDKLIIYSFIKSYYGVDIEIRAEFSGSNKGRMKRNLDIDKYKKDGKILSYPQGDLFCEKGKLCIKSK